MIYTCPFCKSAGSTSAKTSGSLTVQSRVGAGGTGIDIIADYANALGLIRFPNHPVNVHRNRSKRSTGKTGRSRS
ncbi:hypothetical protein BH23CHL4_BH23CHL4_13140 [soil metagenome]